jgi:hypothetical protein
MVFPTSPFFCYTFALVYYTFQGFVHTKSKSVRRLHDITALQYFIWKK